MLWQANFGNFAVSVMRKKSGESSCGMYPVQTTCSKSPHEEKCELTGLCGGHRNEQMVQYNEHVEYAEKEVKRLQYEKQRLEELLQKVHD